jgi:hypothetical protein
MMGVDGAGSMRKQKRVAVREWQIAAIKKGIAAADRGELIPHEECELGRLPLARNASFCTAARNKPPSDRCLPVLILHARRWPDSL